MLASSIGLIASISKSVTAVAAMILVEQGLLDLDAPVRALLPQLPSEDRRLEVLTLRHLLSHRSDLMDRVPLIDETRPTFGSIEALIEEPLRFRRDPGVEFSYANLNYYIVGAMIERVSGERFEDFAVRNVLRPAGLTSTSYGGDGAPSAPHSRE